MLLIVIHDYTWYSYSITGTPCASHLGTGSSYLAVYQEWHLHANCFMNANASTKV